MRHIHAVVAHNGYSRAQNTTYTDVASDNSTPGWMRASPETRNCPILNLNQLTSLNAMISYVAHKSGAAEFRVERRLADHFNVPNAKCLPAHAFDPAILYLVDSLTR